MRCPRCGHQNAAGTKFCGECGVALVGRCDACGAVNPPANKFCGECGAALSAKIGTRPPAAYTPKHLAEKIVTSKAALEGERKQVTVLFADLKGSMELLADRDPEEARKLLDPVLQLMMDAVHRYEGTVNQVMGDGIMALFGAPIAHEDHAVRGCYAALRMQELMKRYARDARRAHGVNVEIRVGLNSGEVVVRAIGSDLHMDYTAVGQTTHLAARMEQFAAPGAIVITPATLALTEGYVEVKALGSVPVKGLAEAVEVYEVTGAGPARTRLQAAAGRGLTRFVGRDRELEELRRAQQKAAGAYGQVVAVVGEAGVGKSRLVYEFIHSHRLPGWLVLEGVSVSYGRATSYLPMIDVLKGYFRIQDRDDLLQIREKVTGKVLALDKDLQPMLPALLALFDVPVDDAAWLAIDAEQRRQHTFDAVTRLLLRETREQPLLLIFEDLHWIDSETQALLDMLVDGLGSGRLLLLVSYRPEYQHGWNGKASYSQLRLDALPEESAAELLEALLGGDAGLAPLKQRLVRRGNPFFLEETVRTLVETRALAGPRGRYRLTSPVQAIKVAATVQAVLAARIDRLSPENKRLLQIASVIGKDVPFRLLQAIAELPDEVLRRGLDHLRAADFLDEAELFPDLEYSFKHALTHDVTYGGLLRERQRELHARIVRAIEALYRDRLGEQVERLAHHALRGELREKAVGYLRQAGLKARARWVLLDARGWLEEALRVLTALPESSSTLEQAFDIRLELRPVLTQLGEVGPLLECLREAETLAERLGEDHRRARVCAFMTAAHAHFGEPSLAIATGSKALEMAGRLGDLKLRIVTTSFLVDAHYHQGEYARATALATENLAALHPDWVYESFGRSAPASVYDRSWLILSLAELGRFAEASEQESHMIRLAESTRHASVVGSAYCVGTAYRAAGLMRLLEGDWVKARSRIEHAIMMLRTGNAALLLPLAVAASAWALAKCGEVSAALGRVREGERLLERQAAGWVRRYQGWDYHSLGQACLQLGLLADARRLGARRAESSSEYPGSSAHTLRLLGDVATHPDGFDADSGEAYYRQALALAEPRGMRPLVAHCHLGLGQLHQRTGKQQAAGEHLATAAALYRDMDMSFWLAQVEALLERTR